MANTFSMDQQQQLLRQYERHALRSHLQQMVVWYEEQQGKRPVTQGRMGSAYDDLPIDSDDVDIIVDRDDIDLAEFETTCRDGPLPNIESLVSSRHPPRTRWFLHHGLVVSLAAGHIDITCYLLSVGAPVLRTTPTIVLSAATDKQIPLFELLQHHGWTVNTPGLYGTALLQRVTESLPLLSWFLDHGANPNLGEQHDTRDRFDASDTKSCVTLEYAAGRGNVEAVRMLFGAGADVRHGIPLHYAAASCPPGANPHNGQVTPTVEFDRSRIPNLAMLVEHGADVNKAEESRHMVPRYAIVDAVQAGAVERVRWLLEHGADPELKGAYGSAATNAVRWGTAEMRGVIDEAMTARKGSMWSQST